MRGEEKEGFGLWLDEEDRVNRSIRLLFVGRRKGLDRRILICRGNNLERG